METWEEDRRAKLIHQSNELNVLYDLSIKYTEGAVRPPSGQRSVLPEAPTNKLLLMCVWLE